MEDPFADLDRPIEKASGMGPFPALWLHNGYYTLTFPCGTHKTFRVRTEQGKAFRGRRTLGIMTGPSVEAGEFETFAFVEEAGFQLWKRLRSEKYENYASLIWNLAKGEVIEDHELLVSRKCKYCNRALTTPASIESGFGPTCEKRYIK